MTVHPNPLRAPLVVQPRRSPTNGDAKTEGYQPSSDESARRPPGPTQSLLVFVGVICVMVVAVTVVALVGRWWVLIPALLVAVACEIVVLGEIHHLLADDD